MSNNGESRKEMTMSSFDWSRLDAVVLPMLERRLSQFHTAYQIAIFIKNTEPELFDEIGLPIGGQETGIPNSLAVRVASHYHRHPSVEYAELSDDKIDITFQDENNTTKFASKNDGRFSLFRYQQT
jgi:hypothetical protein